MIHLVKISEGVALCRCFS